MKRWHVVGIGAVFLAVTAVATLVVTAPKEAPAPMESPRFQPLSASFISGEEGWVLGVVEPCGSGRPCQQIEHTVDSGRTWQALPSSIPMDASAIRFASANEGWVAAQGNLWWTRDGGIVWKQADWTGATLGQNTAVSGDSIQFVTSNGSGEVELHIGRMGGAAPVISSARTDRDYRAAPFVETVSQDDTTWIWAYGEKRRTSPTDRTVVSASGGVKTVKGQWFPWRPPCRDADEYLATLRASASDRVVALCAAPAATSERQRPRLLVSDDGGETFAAREIPDATLTTLLAVTGDTIALGVDGSIRTSFDAGRQWVQTYSPSTPGGYVNFGSFGGADTESGPGFVTAFTGFTFQTSRSSADNIHRYRSEKALLATYDGGHSWTPVEFGYR